MSNRELAEKIGSSADFPKPKVKRGWSVWIESGTWYTAPTVDRRSFGGHAYDNGGYEEGIRDCSCGCFMLSSASGGPVNPFGPCPKNPKRARAAPLATQEASE